MITRMIRMLEHCFQSDPLTSIGVTLIVLIFVASVVLD